MGWTGQAVETVKRWYDTSQKVSAKTIKRGVNRPYAGGGPYGHGTGYSELSDSLRTEQDLISRYLDYEEMDDYSETASALDIYADDATIPDMETGHAVWAVSSDKIVEAVLNDLLHNRLRIDEDIYGLTRQTGKYGDMYAEILLSNSGVAGLNYLPPPTVRVVEDERQVVLGYIQDTTGRFDLRRDEKERFSEMASGSDGREGTVAFEPWEVVHFKNQSKSINSQYGYGIFEPARWIWRRLIMAEDTALLYKLTRAPARYAFYVDTGDLPPAQARAHVDNVRRAYKKRRVVNKSTNALDFRLNPLSYDEDFWVPTRGGTESTRIEVISGPDYQLVEDLEYFLLKLFSALKVPPSYMGRVGETSRAALSQEDVRFARSVMRLQRVIRIGMRRVCRVHLVALGIDPDAIKWDVRMSVPSQIFELSQIEVMNARADLAGRLVDFYPKEEVLQRVFHHSRDEARDILKLKQTEDRGASLQDAGTQSDILKTYPELSGMDQAGEGAMPGAASPGMENVDWDVVFARVLAKNPALVKNHRLLDEVAERLDGIERMVKTVRRVSKRQRPGSLS